LAENQRSPTGGPRTPFMRIVTREGWGCERGKRFEEKSQEIGGRKNPGLVTGLVMSEEKGRDGGGRSKRKKMRDTKTWGSLPNPEKEEGGGGGVGGGEGETSTQ